MNGKLKSYHSFWLKEAVLVVLFLFAVAAFWYVSAYSRSVVPERSFTISGEGKVVAVPDVAELSLGVLTEGGKNLADLQRENSDKVNRVIRFLKEQGIDGKDIKTQYYSISPRYQSVPCPAVLQTYSETEIIRPCPPSSPEIIGYNISQNLSVKVMDLGKAGDILAGVVQRGANTVSGPNFTIDDPVILQNQAREEAIKQARAKARATAKAGGFKVGKLISIQEGFVSPYFPVAFESRGGLPDQGAGPSIEPGSQEIVVNVTLTYEIK